MSGVRQTWGGYPALQLYRPAALPEWGLVSIDRAPASSARLAAAGRGGHLNVAAVLLRFLSGVRDGGHVCREVLSLTAG